MQFAARRPPLPEPTESTQLTAAPAPTSSCCGPAAPATEATTAKSVAEPRSACCGDPTPNAGSGACCTARAATCGCQSAATSSDDATDAKDDPPTTGRLPVAVIGAGPVGLAAAVQLVAKGETPLSLRPATG